MSGRQRNHSAWPVLILTLIVPVLANATAVAINAATSVECPWPAGLDTIRRHPWWWSIGLTVASIVTALLLHWRQDRQNGDTAPLPPPLWRPPDWVVDRPAEIDRVVAALRRRRTATVGITTALQGAGGFGKTTLADMIACDPRVVGYFKGRIYRVTIGRDVRTRAAIAAKVNETARFITGQDAAFGDPNVAGQHLGRLLAECPRLLLVLDDVWEREQLEPFLIGGDKCVRLVTTRVPAVLAGKAERVQVDQMSPEQARRLLTWELPPLPIGLLEGLMAATGRWPLLLRLVNRILAEAAATGADVPETAREVLTRLRAAGPVAVDELGSSAPVLDLDDPGQRARTVRATVEAGTRRLDGDGAARFMELGIFAEDEVIPVELVVQLWRATGSLDSVQARALCHRLAELSLVTLHSADGGAISLHDVVRDFIRAELGTGRITALNQEFVDIVSGAVSALPAGTPLAADIPYPSHAWWEMGSGQRYLWDHAVAHLLHAGRLDEADALACDLRWIEARLRRFGPSALFADLSLVPTERAASMRSALAREVHLLTPTDPEHAVIDILHSRLAHASQWRQQIAARPNSGGRTTARLRNRWPLPDTAQGPLRLTLNVTLNGHARRVKAVAFSPDGTWLATAGDGTLRLWDVATGRILRTAPGDPKVDVPNYYDAPNYYLGGKGLAVSPDGAWIAISNERGSLQLWDVATGQTIRRVRSLRRKLMDPIREPFLRLGMEIEGDSCEVAISPDGATLVTGETRTGAMRLWDAATGRKIRTLARRVSVSAITFSPDGTWLAATIDKGTVGIVGLLNPFTGQEIRTLRGHTGSVNAVAVSPDGTWIATAGNDQTIRLWTVRSGEAFAVLRGYTGQVNAMAVSPDGARLASVGSDRSVHLWDVNGQRQTARLTGHLAPVLAAAFAPDGVLVATASSDGTVRLWDSTVKWSRSAGANDTGPVTGVAVSPDGTQIATRGGYLPLQPLQLWDLATRQAVPVPETPCWADNAELSPDGVRFAKRGVRVTFSQDSALSATFNSEDGTIELKGTATGRGRPTHILIVDYSDRKPMPISPTSGVRPPLPVESNGGMGVSPDGTLLAAGDKKGTVLLWDTATGQIVCKLEGHTVTARGIAFSPTGNWLATAGHDGVLRVWNVRSSSCATMMRTDGPLDGCAWLPDETGIVTGGVKGLYVFRFLPRRIPRH